MATLVGQLEIHDGSTIMDGDSGSGIRDSGGSPPDLVAAIDEHGV